MEIQIRATSRRDWQALALLMQQVFPAEISPATARGLLLYRMPTIAVAEWQRRLVGFYQFHAASEARTAWLNYFGVTSEARRQGIGTLLLRAYEAQAAGLGYRRSALDAYQDSLGAIRFYERHGYTRIGPILNKFRYAKALTPRMDESAIDPPQEMSPHFVERVFRRSVYLCRVELPLWISQKKTGDKPRF